MSLERSTPPAVNLRRARAAALMMSCSALALLVATEANAQKWTAQGAAAAAARATSAAAGQQSATAAAIAQRSQQALQDAANSVKGMWTAQGAARATAQATAATANIARGTGAGDAAAGILPGLVQDPRVAAGVQNLWTGADTKLSQDIIEGITAVGVNRTGSRTVTTWQYFNISADTLLDFDKGVTGGSVLVRVDGTASRSQILGHIKCTCQLTLINPVGFRLAGSSTLEAKSLIVAAGLDINSNQAASVFFGTKQDPNDITKTITGFFPDYNQPDKPNNPNGTPAGKYDFVVPLGEASANKAFAESGILPNATSTGTGGYSGMFSLGNAPGGGKNAMIQVDAGAMIRTLPGENGAGGYVALLAPTVRNQGSIVAQNGQIILAAGSNIILQEPLSTDSGVNTALTIISLQGNTARTVGSFTYLLDWTKNFESLNLKGAALAVNDTAGLLFGIDSAVTLVGDVVRQKGGVVASTSITRPGSITMQTNDSANATDVIIDSKSVTAIIPDTLLKTFEEPTFAASYGSFIPAGFDATGGSIPTSELTGNYFQTNIQPKITISAQRNVDIADALVVAPSAAMEIKGSGLDGTTALLEAGSRIELGGLTNVSVPVSSYAINILVTANEVADTPLARTLIGQTVTIDARQSGTRADGFKWVGSPILNAAGFVNTLPQTLEQTLTAGGSFKVSGVKNFIQQPGGAAGSATAGKSAASINVSGGFVAYAAGQIKTTQLLSSTGRIVDIGKADPNFSYTIVPQNPRSLANFNQPGYLAGGNAGSVSISAVAPVLQGAIYGDTLVGERQRAGLDAMPAGAALTLTFFGGSTPNPYNVVLQSRTGNASSDPYGLANFSLGSTNWTPTLTDNLFPLFTENLTASLFGSITINGGRQLSMTSGTSLTVRPGGRIAMDGVSVIDGILNAPGGSIDLSGFTYVQNSTSQKPPVDALVIGPHAVLNVRGLWVNDARLGYNDLQGSAFIDGGSVKISTQPASVQVGSDFVDVTQSIVLAPGSVIDVSSGGYVGSNGTQKLASDGLPVGKGGSLSLLTYNGTWTNPIDGDPKPNFYPTGTNAPNQANVVLGGTIYSGGFDGGGTLTLQASTVTIDQGAGVRSYLSQAKIDGRVGDDGLVKQLSSALGVSQQTVRGWFTAATGGAHATAGELVLPSSFFSSNGFSNYVLTSRYGSTTVTAGTQVVLRQTGFSPAGYFGAMPNSGANVRDFIPVAFAPDGLRRPVNLTLAQYAFTAAAQTDPMASAGILLDVGASIVGEAGASVTMAAGGPVKVFGSIVAPGGAINLLSDPQLTSVESKTNNGTSAPPNVVWVGDTALLDVSGVFVRDPRVSTSVSGTVLDGGTITLAGPTVIAEGADPQNSAARPGARFLLNGTKATIDVANSPDARERLLSQDIWSNGGILQLGGSHIFFAGSVSARGGAPLAAGGTLTVGQITTPAGLAPYNATSTASPLVTNLEAIVVEQAGKVAASLQKVGLGSLPATQGALLSAVATVQGQPSTTSSPASLAFIEAGSLDGTGPSGLINNSGFDSVNLSAGTIAFAGSVGLSVPGSITLDTSKGSTAGTAGTIQIVLMKAGTCLNAGTCLMPDNFTSGKPSQYAVADIGNAVVDIKAGYVRLVGIDPVTGKSGKPSDANGTFNVTAQWIDLQRSIAIGNARNVNLTSADAVRLLPDNYGKIVVEAAARSSYSGALFVPGNLTIKAAVVYPATDTQFLLMSFGTNASGVNRNDTITILQNGTAHAPLSAGGTLAIDAQTIVQDGTLWAPLGQIILGKTSTSSLPTDLTNLLPGTAVATTSVTLVDGSLTSVSAKGLTLPYGYTVDDATWYQGAPGIPTSPLAAILALPPEKRVSLFGATVDQRAGSTVDLSGGGDIYATEFVSGTGGSRNVLTTYQLSLSAAGVTVPTYTSQYSDGRQVYALVPTSGSKVSAYDPTFANYPYFSGVSAPAGSNLSGFTIPTSSGTAFGNAITPGMSITILGGNGVPAGTYTLMPGMYATMPGAYRVVQVASGQSPATQGHSTQDGSTYVTGYMGNALTGSRSALASTFLIQSADVWQRSSNIHTASGNSFFRNQAQASNTAVPPLPIDGGTLVLGATTTLNLNGSASFAAADGGLAGQLQVTAAKILVVADDQAAAPGFAAPAGTLVLKTGDLGELGVASVLIGGTAAFSGSAYTITANATDLEVRTDAVNPLQGADLILATKNGGTNGLTVAAGSVINATGPETQSGRDITINSDGALLRVSNGAPVNITRNTTTATGKIAIGTTAGTATLVAGADVRISGKSISVDSGGTNVFAADSAQKRGVTLSAKNYDLSASVINLGNVPGTAPGLTLSAGLINSFAGADTVTLRSGSFFNLYDQQGIVLGDASKQIGTLTLSGSALYHQNDGNTTINAKNVVLADSKLTPNTTNGLTGVRGALTVNATDTISVNVGTTANSTSTMTMFLGGDGTGTGTGTPVANSGWFQNVNFTAGNRIAFVGAGTSNTTTATTSTGTSVQSTTTNAGVLNAGKANVALAASAIVATAGSTQTVLTTGALSLPTRSTESVATTPGGVLNLTAASISGSGTVVASSGSLTLTATAGDINLGDGARIIATGSVVKVLDQTQYAPGGAVQLVANNGAVTLGTGTTVDVSAATDDTTGLRQGYAGSLTIRSKNATTLNGTLLGRGGVYKTSDGSIHDARELGGDFSLQAGSLVGSLPLSSFTRSFAVTLDTGNITIDQTLTSGKVTLTANTGTVTVNGTIDASGPSGNFISLFGATEVKVGAGAQLLANFRKLDAENPAAHQTKSTGGDAGDATINLVQNGGTITLGTTGTPDVDSTGAAKVDAKYGYQQVSSSGSITVAEGATFNVSGGPGGDGISNNSGSIILRAPIVNVVDKNGVLTDRKVDVKFGGTVLTNAPEKDRGNVVVVNAYATWSTTDSSTGGQHFDGIIDPAGWYDNTGTRVDGKFTTYQNTTSGVTAPQNGTTCNNGCVTRTNTGPTDGLFTPTNAYQNHVDFYQKTLVSFVQDFNSALFNVADKQANLSANFTGAKFGDTGSALAGSMRPEISLTNPDTAKNGGNISVLSNWNLGGTTRADINKPFAPSYRTSDGNAGTLTLRAVNNIKVNATITDGFYEASDAFGGSVTVANLIDNNPQLAGTRADLNTTSAASLMGITPGNNGSFSYDFVAGANFTKAVNPDAVVATSSLDQNLTGNVEVSGRTSYRITNQLSNNGAIINVPAMVRTGTGSIRIAAAGNFSLVSSTDPTAIGVVYTAGAATALPAGFTAPAVPTNYANVTPTGVVATPTWAANGGSVTITAGQSINGGSQSQIWADWYAHSGASNGTNMPFAGCTGCQTASWINYNTFFQGIGALGGGNVTLTAGQDIKAISASLPETLAVSGGLPDTKNPDGTITKHPAVANYFGGGNLYVKAGRNLNASTFFVGRGSGTIDVGGNIQYNPGTTGGGGVLPLMLAVQDGFIGINARGSVTLGNIYDPASLPSGLNALTVYGLLPGGNGGNSINGIAQVNQYWSNLFTTYGPQSGVSINSTSGDITALTISSDPDKVGTLFARGTESNSVGLKTNNLGLLLPATLSLTALNGDVTLNPADTKAANLLPNPTLTGDAIGNLSIVASGTVNLGAGISMPDLLTKTTQFVGSTTGAALATDQTNYISPLGIPLATLTQALHANDPNPVIIAAGQDIVYNNTSQRPLKLIKPARIEAGNDIVLAPLNTVGGAGLKPTLNFVGQNNDADDVTSIIAGHDLIGGTYALYGPGSFLLQAGHDLGPFRQSEASSGLTNGIMTIGNGSNLGSPFGSASGNASLGVVPYLPAKGADLYLLFGVKSGVNYQGAIAQYVDPANAGEDGIDFLTYIAKVLDKSRADAWTEFKTLSTDRQHLLVNRAFLEFLTQVGKDKRDTASPYYGGYDRAYAAMTTLFPPGQGDYTDQSPFSSTTPSSRMVSTGNLNVSQSLVATQMGGDINIIGPGGGITVGSASRDTLKPLQQGILTLAGGTIRAFADQSILLNQSRMLTVQGGNVELFSGNGGISAGEGPKTYVSNPPVSLICDQNGVCGINPSGLVSGAGIGALITLPGQDPKNSDVHAYAPRGFIDAGPAGFRGNDITVDAPQIFNAYNFLASGITQGVPVATPAVSATVAAPPTDQSGTKQAAAASTTTQSTAPAKSSIVVVEVLGYGGGPTGSTDPAPAAPAGDSAGPASGGPGSGSRISAPAASGPGANNGNTGPDDGDKRKGQEAPAQQP